MTIDRKTLLLNLHSSFHLRVVHAAIGSYLCRFAKNTMAVNRLLMIFDDSGRDDSFIRDANSGELLEMRTGFLYFIPCHHKICIYLSENLFFISLHFNLDLFYGFDVFKDYGKCVVVENPPLVRETRQLIHREDEIRTLCRINEIIFNLCVRLLTDHPAKVQENSVSWRKYENVLDFVQNSGDAMTTVAMLAEMCSMRQDVFSRTFTRDMGVTPKDFVTNILMRKATEMLLTSSDNIRTVAKNLNFSSEYYFSRFFKKNTGMAPRLFRRMNGG